MAASSPSPWFAKFFGAPEKAAPRAEVFCVGHAGGTAADFRRWDAAAGPSVRFVPVALPGRAARASEPALATVAAVADALAREISARRCRSGSRNAPAVALFGMSFGSLVAYETALRLTRTDQDAPAALVVSARRPPHTADPAPGEVALSTLDDAGFVAGLGARYGDDTLARLVREQPDMAARFVPQMRADIGAFDRYAPVPAPQTPAQAPLRCPLLAVRGETDPRMNAAEAAAWSLHTSAPPVPPRSYPGGHFFVRDQDVARSLVHDIERFVLDSLDAAAAASQPKPEPVAPAPAPKPAARAQNAFHFSSGFDDDDDFPACF